MTTTTSVSRRIWWITTLFLALLAVATCNIRSSSSDDDGDSDSAKVVFTSVVDEPVKLFWQDVEDATNWIQVAEISSGEGLRLDSAIGHSFSYTLERMEQRIITVEDSYQAFVMGPTHFLVKCSTSEGDIRAHIMPEWSPFGAARFLHLVKIGYFDSCALNRVVKKFLTQFGISSSHSMRTYWRGRSIMDDAPIPIDKTERNFQPGYLSYAGSGPDSRSTEIFVVMPETKQSQLNHFGQNAWETPFGYVEPADVEQVVGNWYAYGDMSPWGEGPNPQNIYKEDGYEYLKRDFPLMSYIDKCEIVSKSFLADETEDEEEL